MQIQIYESCSSFNETTAKMLNFLEKEIFHKPLSKNQPEGFSNKMFTGQESDNYLMGNMAFNARNINNTVNTFPLGNKNQQNNFVNRNMNANQFGNLYGNGFNTNNHFPSNFPFENNNINNGFNYINDGLKNPINNEFNNNNQSMYDYQTNTNPHIQNLHSKFFFC